jgi:hypothetical protein
MNAKNEEQSMTDFAGRVRWAGQNASLCHAPDATEFMTQLIAEAETVFSKYWEADE